VSTGETAFPQNFLLFPTAGRQSPEETKPPGSSVAESDVALRKSHPSLEREADSDIRWDFGPNGNEWIMRFRHLKTIACLNPGPRLRAGAPDQVECLGTAPLYEGYFSANRYTLKHQTFAGGWTPPILREVFERGHAVGILPYDPKADRVVLIEQFRAGAMIAGWRPWLIEIAAGIIEPGETPAEVAFRETAEETGLAVQRLEFIAHVLCTPGGSTETIALFCGEVDASAAPTQAGLAHENEDIRVFSLSADEAVGLLSAGVIDNASTLMTLQWFALNRARLRALWLDGKETP
jgi:ADP-ribose pyrophosphatase